MDEEVYETVVDEPDELAYIKFYYYCPLNFRVQQKN